MSVICWKCTATVHLWIFWCCAELWIRTEIFFERILLAR